jgi:hypothetical protein
MKPTQRCRPECLTAGYPLGRCILDGCPMQRRSRVPPWLVGLLLGLALAMLPASG